eukprot:gb/GECH01011813.1/.p1 GENE.gb/GECH01011813.1/~~gb/GECH01011813.1/.p1  ORF type:complete len:349 (+),score=82.49 gb/GECH01011813.1/:1-1047(+)
MSSPSFVEVLDDLCCRFLLNIPHAEYESFERLFFQIEEAHWFYLDFYTSKYSHLPKLSLRDFGAKIFSHCPILREFYSVADEVFNTFQNYKYQVPVNGAIILNKDLSKVLLVKGWKASCWNFPRGKLSYGENDMECAIREVKEEIGFDIRPFVKKDRFINLNLRNQPTKLFIAPGVSEDEVSFVPQTRKEISAIKWHYLEQLPHTNPRNSPSVRKSNRFFRIVPFLRELSKWLHDRKERHNPVFQGRNETLECALPQNNTNFRPIPNTPVTPRPSSRQKHPKAVNKAFNSNKKYSNNNNNKNNNKFKNNNVISNSKSYQQQSPTQYKYESQMNQFTFNTAQLLSAVSN